MPPDPPPPSHPPDPTDPTPPPHLLEIPSATLAGAVKPTGVAARLSSNGHSLMPQDAKSAAGKPHACNQCSYRTARRHDLTKHMRVHSRTHDPKSEEKKHACPNCSYRTSRKHDLAKHARVHTGEKPFHCTECNYRASVKSHLTQHLRVHTGEKPHACNKCDYRASVKSQLVRHMRSHTGEKPCACDMCDYRAAHKSDLATHIMRRHTGEKPYQCDLCDYRAATKSHVTRHRQTHAAAKMQRRVTDDVPVAPQLHGDSVAVFGAPAPAHGVPAAIDAESMRATMRQAMDSAGFTHHTMATAPMGAPMPMSSLATNMSHPPPVQQIHTSWSTQMMHVPPHSLTTAMGPPNVALPPGMHHAMQPPLTHPPPLDIDPAGLQMRGLMP